jgi:outer membrane lipase/esterase
MDGMLQRQKWMLAGAVALLLAACGGGGGDTTTRVQVTGVKVFGDSLPDVGTFGFKFTVQGAQSHVYPERVAMSYGLRPGCNFFSFNGTTFVPNSTPGCTNWAVGGGVINGAASGLVAADPRNIGVQFATAAQVIGAGGYAAGDLLVVDGGGNDAAALVGAYLRLPSDQGAAYFAALGTLLTPAQLQAAQAGGATGLATAGNQYMTALADSFYTMINTQALQRGAQRIVLLNMPSITNTPRFQMVLDGIAAASGGGTTGAAARAQSEALFKGWVVAFNTQIAARFAGNSKVAIVDFYTAFNEQVTMPAQYGLTNARNTACPPAGVGSDGLPVYNFPTCTDAALSAQTPPAGATGGANWWKTWAFSDGFHPTPYGHQLLAQLISRTMAQAGWL